MFPLWPLVAAMALHHLNLGASEVHLYLDVPSPDVVALLRPFPAVRMTTCDANYWRGKRPDRVTGRQSRNANHAKRRAATDWILHCDADEFVAGRRPLSEALEQAPATADCVLLSPVERVLVAGSTPNRLFDGPFRRALVGTAAGGRQIYPESWHWMNAGVTGHKSGKVLVRTGADVQISIHHARRRGAPEGERLPAFMLPDHMLLHYDGITPLHYLAKLLGRSSDASASPWRKAQMEEINRRAQDPAALIEVTRLLRAVTPDQAAQLRAAGALIDDVVTPDIAVQALCPAAVVDQAAFDRLIRARSGGRLDAVPDIGWTV